MLWIAGANSTYVLPEDRPRMDELFPATRLVTIKNAGHWVHSEQPEIFTETLRRFLERVEAALTVSRATGGGTPSPRAARRPR